MYWKSIIKTANTSSYFVGKDYFGEDGAQNYLVFQSIRRYSKKTNAKYTSLWKSKGPSGETITLYVTSDNSFNPLIDHCGNKIRVKFSGKCLKQSNKLTYSYGAKVNIYIVYEPGPSGSNDSDPTLKIIYLVRLLWLKTQILKNMDILAMELDLIEDQPFHFQVVDLVEMY